MRRRKHSDDSRHYFDWLEVAARDLLAARILVEEGQCLEMAAFHCQQCMEKSLKAYLISETGRPVDGHNLTWLCRQAVRRDGAFSPWLAHTAGLNRLYIETRYPSDDDLLIDRPAMENIYEITGSLYTKICELVYDEVPEEVD